MDSMTKKNTPINALRSLLTDRQIRDIKRLGIDNLILRFEEYPGVITATKDDIKKFFSNSKIVYGDIITINDDKKFPPIDFDKVLILGINDLDMEMSKINDIIAKIDSIGPGSHEKMLRIAHNNNSNYEFIFLLLKEENKFQRNIEIEEDYLTNASYMCVECEFHPVRYNFKEQHCPYCKKSTSLSIKIGKCFLKILRENVSDAYIDKEKLKNNEKTKDKIIKSIYKECTKAANKDQFELLKQSVKGIIEKKYDKLLDYYITEYNLIYGLDETPKYIKSIKVTNLFGYNTYNISFDYKSKLSIIYGANGIGKTTVFKFLKYLLIEEDDYIEVLNYFKKIPFDRFIVTFADDSAIAVEKIQGRIQFNYCYAHGLSAFDAVGSGVSISFCEDENKSIEKLKKHYLNVKAVTPRVNEYNRFIFIDVNRVSNFNTMERYFQFNNLRNQLAHYNIKEDDLKKYFDNNQKGFETPSFISDFNYRFHQCYMELMKFYKDLKKYDEYLFVSQSAINSIEYLKHSPFSIGFINDIKYLNENKQKENYKANYYGYKKYFENRVQKLCKLAVKYIEFKNAFEDIYDENSPTAKIINIDKKGKIFIQARQSLNDEKYSVTLGFEELSSGEKNLANIFYNLIFKTTDDAIVLIDEPEISLHTVWQMQFADVVLRLINDKQNMQVIVASHSPFITSGNEEYMVLPEFVDGDNNG